MVRVRDDVDIRVGAVDLPAGREDGNGRVGLVPIWRVTCLLSHLMLQVFHLKWDSAFSILHYTLELICLGMRNTA